MSVAVDSLANRCQAAGAKVAARVLLLADDFRTNRGRRALEHDVARSRLQPTEAVLVLAFVDELVCHGMSVDVAAAWGLWRDGCAACALYRIDGAPGDRCDEHGGRA